MDAETPAWKQPFWYWIKWAKAWPFSVEALSGLFGIESPDTRSLIAMRKKQNTRRNIAQSVHRIYAAGLYVTAGFIVGFDSEQGSVADAIIELIEEAAIPVCYARCLGNRLAAPVNVRSGSLTDIAHRASTGWSREGVGAAPALQLCFSSSRGLVSSVGGSTSARWALRNAVFSSLFRFFSSLRARAVLARSARSRP